jgi:hypothetical protein
VEGLEVFPNPATVQLCLKEVLSNDQKHFSLFDSKGLMIRQGNISGGRCIDIADLPSGVYQMHLYSPSGLTQKRWIKL